MLPVAWQLDQNITNICTGRFCQAGRQTPSDALIEICVKGTPLSILSGPIRLFCCHKMSSSHKNSLCLHDNIVVLDEASIKHIISAVASRRPIKIQEARAWVSRSMYRCPCVVIALACKHILPITESVRELTRNNQRPHFLDGRLDLWWTLFSHDLIKCDIFDTKWLQSQLNHIACINRPTNDMLSAAHYLMIWGQYLDNPSKIPGWALHKKLKQAILFEIGLLGIVPEKILQKGHQTNRPALHRDILHHIAGMVFCT